ncbi:MAG: ATP-binding protein [Arcobacter sp.]|nr:MAG: ATP-binding protein [Arcobacter sp.]
MKKITISLVLIAILGFANETTVAGFSSPESVIVNNQDVYVSNVGKELKPTDIDGDGFISKLDLNGEIKELHFIDGLNAPKGMCIIDDTLFVADIDSVKGFDVKTKKEVFSLTFDNVNFLNDISKKDEYSFFVGASDVGAIYEVNIKNKSYKKLIDFTTANGLFYEDGILYAAELGSNPKTMFDGKGRFYQIDLQSNKLTQLASFEGVLDGVHKVGDKLYISDWGKSKKSGIVRVYDLKTKEESVLKLEPFMGAADLWIDEKSNKLYLPQMLGNKLTIIDL